MGRSITRKAYIIFLPKEGNETLDKGEYVERRTVVFHEDKTPRLIRELGNERTAPPPPEKSKCSWGKDEYGDFLYDVLV